MASGMKGGWRSRKAPYHVGPWSFIILRALEDSEIFKPSGNLIGFTLLKVYGEWKSSGKDMYGGERRCQG